MKKIWMIVLVLGLAVTAWGEERMPGAPPQPVPTWSRRQGTAWRRARTPNAALYATRFRREPIGYEEFNPNPYMAWVSTYPSYSSTSLGPGGTIGNLAGTNPEDTAHWYRYWLGPGEAIHWHITSSNPAVTKYHADLYQYVDGRPGPLLAQAARANNPDSIVFQNGPIGTDVFLRFALARGNPSDQYALWGIGSAPRNAPVYLSQFALNGAVQNGNEITDGVEAEMVSGRFDDWYYWYWPGTINGQPVAAMKLGLAYDSTRITLDLYALSPVGDTLLASTNGPHYTAGTGWLTKETGWIYRSPEDTGGLWLHVQTTRDYGKNQIYRINNALAMTSEGAEIAFPYYSQYSQMNEAYLESPYLYPPYEEESDTHYRHQRRGREVPPPPPPPPPQPQYRAILTPIRKSPPPENTSGARPVQRPPDDIAIVPPPQRKEAPVKIQEPVRQAPQPDTVRALPSPQPPPPSGGQGGSPGGSVRGAKTLPSGPEN